MWKFMTMANGEVISAALTSAAIADIIATSRSCSERFSPRTATRRAAAPQATPFLLKPRGFFPGRLSPLFQEPKPAKLAAFHYISSS